MILVDSSAWVEFFRGSVPLAATVDALIDSNDVALCGPIVTELRRGLRSAVERRRVIPLLDGCHFLSQPHQLWEEAGELGYFLGRRGASVKTLDLLIAAHALTHDTPILTKDRDFDNMRAAGVPIHLVEW